MLSFTELYIAAKTKKAKNIIIILFVLGWIIQIVGLAIYGLETVNVFTSLLFIGLIYFILYELLNYIAKRFLMSLEKQTYIFISLKSTFITLTFLELTLRIFNVNATYAEQRINHYFPPFDNHSAGWFHIWTGNHNLVTSEYNYERTINRESLSDIDHPIKKQKDEYRIIGLGDSFTEGDGAHKDSTWLKALERNLSRYNFKHNLTFINAGVCGSDVFFEYILLEEKLLKYKPDLVLLTLNNSDIIDVIIRGGMERFQKDGTSKFNNAPVWEPLFAVSYLSRIVIKNILNYNEIFVTKNSDKYGIARSEIYKALQVIQELSLVKRFKFVVVFHPVKDEIVNNQLELSDVLTKVKEETQIENFNLLEYFRKEEGINSTNYDELFWADDGHHNAKGYKKFANGIEWKLNKMEIFNIDSLY